MEQPAGNYLRKIRERLGLSVRDVQEASAVIAQQERNTEFHICAARLSQIETEKSLPSIMKIFTLSAIYGIDFMDVLGSYGVNPDRVHHYHNLLKLQSTHPIAVEAHSLDTKVTLPVRLDPSFRWETTQLLNRLVALWGEMPAALLQELSPRRNMYGYIGLQDHTMYPLLRPGALVMIDGHRRRVVQTGWTNEAERPIYFVELREGYRCAWCQVNGSRITLIPHPISSVATESFGFPAEAEIIGQVVGVAMRIVPAEGESHGNGSTPPKRLSFEK